MKWIQAIVIMMAGTGVLAQEMSLPLGPLTQDFKIHHNNTLSSSFTVSQTTVDILVDTASTTDFSITLPNGEVLNEGNSGFHGFSWMSVPTVIDPSINKTRIASVNTPVGVYQFSISAIDSVGARLSVIEQPSPQYRAMVGVPGIPIGSNELFTLSAALLNGQQPATNATISATLYDHVGQKVSDSIYLKDDGVSPDLTSGDGVYTAVSSVIGEADYEAVFETAWGDYRGHTYEPFVVSNVPLSISGVINYTELDNNTNGQTDGVRIVVEETYPRQPGEYKVRLLINGAEGGVIGDAIFISNPEEPLVFDFSTEELETLTGQPWLVASVDAWKGARPLGLWPINAILDIDPASLEQPPINVIGVVGDRGLDDDDDGIFEMLQIDYEVIVSRSGSYGLSTDIRGTDGSLISSAANASLQLTEGTNTFSLNFLGADIGKSGLDGPFSTTNFLIYPNFDWNDEAAQLLDTVGETGAYTCDQFVGCDTSLREEILRIAASLCDKHGHLLTVKLHQIDALAKRHPDVAERQLNALYHRALSLERSGSCPPISGWPGDTAN